MTSGEIFLWGFGGSLAVEVVEFMKTYYAETYTLPFRYRLWHFYLLRLILGAIGGGLAIAYKIDNPILAANIGAATPLLIESLTRMGRVEQVPAAVPLPQVAPPSFSQDLSVAGSEPSLPSGS
jgi:hypothetical protein